MTFVMRRLFLFYKQEFSSPCIPEPVPETNKVGQVVNSGTGRSHASEFFIPRILEGKFTDAYPLKDAYKDLVSAAEIASNRGIPMPVLSAATNTYQMALLKGYGDRDKGGMIGVYEDLLNVSFRTPSSLENKVRR